MVLGISRIKSLPTAAGLCVLLLLQMVSTTGTALRDDIMTRSQRGRPPSCRWAGAAGGVKLCQVIKGGRYTGKYDKRSNLHACLTTSHTANVLCGTDQVAPLQNSITLTELSQIPPACRGMIPNFPLRRSIPLTLHFTGLDGLWQILKLFIT